MPGTSVYNEPSGSAVYEEKIKRSVFIANLEPVHSEDEARDFLNRITSQHRDATHNCRAYILGSSGESEYSSDDGEPSGTAGRPILLAIKRSTLVNVMVIVTRYFGGVKLGTRGLIDAYGLTASKALELAGVVERVITQKFFILLDYASMGVITRLLETHNAVNLSWNYQESVSVNADVPVNYCEGLSRELEELRARKIIKSFDNNLTAL
ncbi:MAG: YigZ family protein [Synergistaceae bacterium]|nr:YigZ family protein [Synergistaceae bacterium]